jgi:ParB family chromosome partitioning protein
MGKTEALLKEMAGNLAESIGVRAGDGPPLAAQSKLPIGKASPKDGYTRDRSAGEMRLANIVPDPNQPRKEFDQEAIERLSESIKARGLLQPLRVRWNSELGKHVILVGERRYRAALLAGLASVPCIFVENQITEAEVLEEQLVENLLREDLNPIEQAHSFQRYLEIVGCHAKDLAKLLKVAPSTVTRALSLLKLPEPIQEQVAGGEISAKTGFEIAKLKDDSARKEIAKRVVTENLTADDAAEVVRMTMGKAKSTKKGTHITCRIGDGIKITLSSPKPLSHHEVTQAIEQFLKQLLERDAA